MPKVSENAIKKIEKEHLGGITSAALLAFFVEHEIRFGEATLRKWVQLGLLPRSVRVGQKGKHQGSKGKYPISVVRRILQIKDLMAKDITIEEIQGRILFVRGDIESLEETLGKIFQVLERTVEDRSKEGISGRAVAADIKRARVLARDIVDRVEKIEARLIAEGDAQRSEVVAS